jgi:hypothetical protein
MKRGEIAQNLPQFHSPPTEWKANLALVQKFVAR